MTKLLVTAAITLLASLARGEATPAVRAGGLRSAVDWIPAIARSDGSMMPTTADPKFGRTADLPNGAPGNLRLHAVLRMDGGTISFWVKPNWTRNSNASHTLMSARWIDSRQSYLAISEGWWEPAGRLRLYFIASNEDIVHCSTEERLPTSTWSLVTATWTSGKSGFCKLFVDDELRAVTRASWKGGRILEDIALGDDSAATDVRGRTGQASIAGLRIIGHPVSHREVIERYRTEEDGAALYRKKWAWLDEGNGGNGAAGLPQTASRPHFDRAIFDEDIAWATGPAAIDERLKRIAEAGFNVYVPCVWHGRGALFPSHVVPSDSRMRSQFDRGWDPLSYLIAQAHARGIAVHPWFTVVRREDDAHPEWAEPGTPLGAYDVHQPGFREFALQMMLDVVSRYQVDGLNLDYIRAMGVCTSEFCRRDYQMKTGTQLLADFKNGSPDLAARRRIESWQDAAVGELVDEFSKRAHALKPELNISVDGNAVTSEDQRPLEGRDEIRWANKNWIDTIYHMDYRAEIDLPAVRSARAQLTDPGKLRLVVSNFDSIDDTAVPRSGKWLAKVIDLTWRTQDRGVGVYLYGLLSDEQIAMLGSSGRELH